MKIEKDKYFGQAKRIAHWKIDTPFENWLSRKADSSELWKTLYVFYYRVSNPKYYKNGLQFINKTLQKYSYLDNISKDYLTKDMTYCLHRFGASFEDYCIYHFIDLTNKCRNTFVSDKLRHYYAELLNNKEISTILDDKSKCYSIYKQFYGRDAVACISSNDKSHFMSFVSHHNCFIRKPLNENCGHGVHFVTLSNQNAASYFDEAIKKSPFIVEEPIKQGEVLKQLHPESINTVRLATILINGEMMINGAVLRIGSGSSVVDNAGSGGMYASVNIETGVVQSSARDYLGNEYLFHPDTKIQIIGYQLPEWDNLLNLLQKIVTHCAGSNLVSWDMAYSETGWIMVEGNAVGSWDVLQSNKQIGLKEMLFSRMDLFFANK